MGRAEYGAAPPAPAGPDRNRRASGPRDPDAAHRRRTAPDAARPGAAPDLSAPTAVALVPLRTGGKSRLSAALDAPSRHALVLAMLDDVVAALRDGGVTDVRILAADDAAAAAAADRGLAALRDTGPGGDLRAAVDAGLAAVGPDRPRLVVAADLPGLMAADVARLRAAADRPARVTLLPTPDGGTAVLVLPVDVVVPARYGPDSAVLHADAARAAGYEVDVLAAGPGARDVDGPGDLADVTGLDAASGPGIGTATAATLTAIAARRRT